MAGCSTSTPALASASMTRAVAPTRVSSVRIAHSQVPLASCSRSSQSRAFSIARWIFSGDSPAWSRSSASMTAGCPAKTTAANATAAMNRLTGCTAGLANGNDLK